MQKTEFDMAKIHTEIINLKTKRICILIQTTKVYMILIQKKKPLVTQKIHRSNTLQKRPEKQQKTI